MALLPTHPSAQSANQRDGMINIRSDEEQQPEELLASFDQHAQEDLGRMMEDPLIYTSLAKSLCPAVYGHESIKQAVLLMLFGGVHKTTREVSGGWEGGVLCNLLLVSHHAWR